MSDHSTALVPLATSYYQTPELFFAGKQVDTGIFAESLIYYDTVYVYAGNPTQFASFISTLVQQGLDYEHLIELVDSGSLKFFTIVTIHPFCARDLVTDEPRVDIIFNLIAADESAIKTPNYFEKKFLDTDLLRDSFSGLSYFNQKEFDRFCELAASNSVVFDNEIISSGLVENAYQDFLRPERLKLLIMNVLCELYQLQNLGDVPDFEVKIRELDNKNINEIAKNLNSIVVGRTLDDGRYIIYEIDYQIPTAGLKKKDEVVRVFKTLPLSLAGVNDLYIRSAGKMKTDLFLSSPISRVVGDKLFEITEFEASSENIRKQNLVEKLELIVKFPDLQRLINQNLVDFDAILKIRKKAKKFRMWLQQTSVDHKADFEVFSAYHNEVAEEIGFVKAARKSLSIFGFVGGAAAGGALSHYLGNNPFIGGVAGALSAEVVKASGRKITEKLFDYGANIGKDWTPICFGNWYKDRITKILKER